VVPACLAPYLAAIPAHACPRCGQPPCGDGCASLGCARGWTRIRRIDAVLGYKRGDVERLILAGKRLDAWAIAALARILAGWLLDVAAPRAYDVILPVPFHRASLRGRAAHPLTAIYLDTWPAVRPRIPADDLTPPLLVRTIPLPARRALSEPARWRSARGSVALGFPARALRGAQVLLVDDVVTSGATVSECARVLLDDGGAAVVDAVVLARQPWRAAASVPPARGRGHRDHV
jgi:predicted amidophosphoribosyltransferase